MPKRPAATLLAALVATSTLVGANVMSAAQTTTPTTPSLPGPPQPTSRLLQSSPPGGSGNYVVSAAANEHASFLWVVDNIQRVVTLCEKADSKDFICTKKPLP
jgi:hypothetical protein